MFRSVPIGASDSVRKYFLQSQEAEARANASTTDDGSPVENSGTLRQLTEDKMNQTREEFLKRHTEHAQRLDDLAGELQTLDLSEISHQVGSDPPDHYFLACSSANLIWVGNSGGRGQKTSDAPPTVRQLFYTDKTIFPGSL